MKDNNTTMGKQDDDECYSESTKSQQKNSQTNTSHSNTPLTPTKDHPLKDLVKKSSNPSRSEFMDDSDSDSFEEQINNKNTNIIYTNDALILHDNNAGSVNASTNNEINNHISPENENQNQHVQQSSTTNEHHIDDETNNNTRSVEMNIDNMDSDEEMDKKMLAPERVIRRKKSPSRNANNNSVNIKNNNRMSYPIGRDRSHHRIEDALTKSTDRIDGEL